MDFLVAVILLTVLSPLMLLAATLIAVNRDGPILFKQKRPGKDGKIFTVYKFRTMSTALIDRNGKELSDFERMTRIGKILRKTSIDELPQLFNVLKGDMSLIGPRPERPFFVDKFKEEIPRYMIKHQVRPGMTGWAQVNGLRGDTSIRKRIELDLFYIENWSVSFDIRILFLTVFKGFVNKNAY